MEIRRTIPVTVPAETAWNALAYRFYEVSHWARGLESCERLDSVGPAGRNDRQCTVVGMGTIVEQLQRFDDRTRTFSYRVVRGAPMMARDLSNTWSVRSTARDHSEITFTIRIDLKPVSGALLGWMIKRRLHAMADQIAEDLKAFVETGEPSEPKRLEQAA